MNRRVVMKMMASFFLSAYSLSALIHNFVRSTLVDVTIGGAWLLSC